ncbi:MAG: Y-family DNA polymerase [Cyanobacteriota bacterium]|jgi:DNA polymerase V|nr:Y-family DNA polymerase [Cyanobacteriota bacterium]
MSRGNRTAIVLIDGNNFYASCEAVLDPALRGRPLVVLSNNDGCIVSRSQEARALGIAMGTPYFKARAELERHGVVVRSSNYALYADMSARLMATLEAWVESLEVYSIDEAFGCLSRGGDSDLLGWGHGLRQDVQRQLGLPVAVGIGPSKVLAKLANRLAKRPPAGAPPGGGRGVFDLGAVSDPDPWLAALPVGEVWGIGRQLGEWCRRRGVADARALRDMPDGELRRKCGVVGVRLQQELRGIACLPLELAPPARRETCVSRSFSTPIQELGPLREAIASYVSRAAEKLRHQRQRARLLTVFVRSSPFNGTSFYRNAATVELALPSNDTAVLLAAALPLAARLLRPHKPLQKAGVLLQALEPEDQLQHHLFTPLPTEQQTRREALMATVDGLNRRYGRGTVRWAACGLQPSWAMRRERLSGAATTCLQDLPTVLAL